MDIRNNKGYTGIDVSIAILIFVILVPLIMGVAYNISKSGNYTDQKAFAINVATNSLETAKTVSKIENVYSKTEDIPENLEGDTLLTKLTTTMQNIDTNNQPAIATENGKESIFFVVTDQKNNRYKVKIDVTDYIDTLDPTPDGAKHNVVKKVITKVTFSTGNKEQNIEISTVISKY